MARLFKAMLGYDTTVTKVPKYGNVVNRMSDIKDQISRLRGNLDPTTDAELEGKLDSFQVILDAANLALVDENTFNTFMAPPRTRKR